MKTIELTQQQAHDVEQSRINLDHISISVEELVRVLRDWESRPTVSSKRIFSTLSVLLLAAFILGIDYSEIPFMGISETDGGVRVSLLLFGGLVVSGFAYLWNRDIDLKARQYELARIRRNIARARKCVDNMRKAIGSENLVDFPNVRLVCESDQRGRQSVVKFKVAQLDAVLMYENEVSGDALRKVFFERFELCTLMGAAIVGCIGLVRYWFFWPN